MYVNFLMDKLIKNITMYIIKFIDNMISRSINHYHHAVSELPADDAVSSSNKIEYVVYAAISPTSGPIVTCTVAMNYLLSELMSQEAPFTSNEILTEFSLEETDKVILILATVSGKMVHLTIPFDDESKWHIGDAIIDRPLFGMIENCI